MPTQTLTAGDIMNPNITSVVADWSVERLAEYLLKKEISGAPVIDDGELVGVVSLSDIAWYQTLQEEEPADAPFEPHWFYQRDTGAPLSEQQLGELRGQDFSKSGTVREIMTPTIFDVDEDTPVRDVAGLMVNNHIHRVFVTRNGELVGIITSIDLLKLIVDED